MPTVPVPPMALKVLHDPGSKMTITISGCRNLQYWKPSVGDCSCDKASSSGWKLLFIAIFFYLASYFGLNIYKNNQSRRFCFTVTANESKIINKKEKKKKILCKIETILLKFGCFKQNDSLTVSAKIIFLTSWITNI